MPFKSILVAIDGSKESEKATEVAIELALKLEAKLVFLNVVNVPELSAISAGSDKQEKTIRDGLVVAGKKILEKAVEASRNRKVSASEKISFGYPADTIVKEAAKLDADMIVMGSRGTTGIRRVILGSTAEKVLRWSGIPVLIVKDQPEKGEDESHAVEIHSAESRYM